MERIDLWGTCGGHAGDAEVQRVAAGSAALRLLGVDEVPQPDQAPGGVPPGAVAQVGVHERHAGAVASALRHAPRHARVRDHHEPVGHLHVRHRQEPAADVISDAAP